MFVFFFEVCFVLLDTFLPQAVCVLANLSTTGAVRRRSVPCQHLRRSLVVRLFDVLAARKWSCQCGQRPVMHDPSRGLGNQKQHVRNFEQGRHHCGAGGFFWRWTWPPEHSFLTRPHFTRSRRRHFEKGEWANSEEESQEQVDGVRQQHDRHRATGVAGRRQSAHWADSRVPSANPESSSGSSSCQDRGWRASGRGEHHQIHYSRRHFRTDQREAIRCAHEGACWRGKDGVDARTAPGDAPAHRRGKSSTAAWCSDVCVCEVRVHAGSSVAVGGGFLQPPDPGDLFSSIRPDSSCACVPLIRRMSWLKSCARMCVWVSGLCLCFGFRGAPSSCAFSLAVACCCRRGCGQQVQVYACACLWMCRVSLSLSPSPRRATIRAHLPSRKNRVPEGKRNIDEQTRRSTRV